MASATSKKRGAAADAYCPHCHLLIDKKVGEDWQIVVVQAAYNMPQAHLFNEPTQQ